MYKLFTVYYRQKQLWKYADQIDLNAHVNSFGGGVFTSLAILIQAILYTYIQVAS